jgi:hypothetical protein
MSFVTAASLALMGGLAWMLIDPNRKLIPIEAEVVSER